MNRLSWVAVGACFAVSGCTTTAVSTSNPSTNCGFALAQAGAGLRLSCTVTGPIPDAQIDPAHPGSTGCSATSFSVFSQNISTGLLGIYGQNGDDSPARVRVGVTVGTGSHTGKIGKSAGNDCDATLGPMAMVKTSYAGTYVALVDKSQQPMCVFQSRLTLGTFNQTLSATLSDDVSGASRESTRDALQKRIDLEVATQVNKLLQPAAAPLRESAMNRNGRCPDGFRTFVGS